MAVAPMSYCPGVQLILVLCLMFSVTTLHLRRYPYRFSLLNSVEVISFWVLNLCMVASCLIVGESWHLTRGFAEQLTIGVYGLLAINGVGLVSLLIWAKVVLHDGGPVLEKA